MMKQIKYNGYKNIIGKRLNEIRVEKGLTQNELAAKMQVLNVNIDQQMISKIEKHQRQVTDFEFICFCKCLNVPPEELLKYFDEYDY